MTFSFPFSKKVNFVSCVSLKLHMSYILPVSKQQHEVYLLPHLFIRDFRAPYRVLQYAPLKVKPFYRRADRRTIDRSISIINRIPQQECNCSEYRNAQQSRRRNSSRILSVRFGPPKARLSRRTKGKNLQSEATRESSNKRCPLIRVTLCASFRPLKRCLWTEQSSNRRR